MSSILTALLTFLNSPLGIAIVAGVLLWILNKKFGPEIWRKYAGTLVAAVKWAEKAIPDDTENAGARRFDQALQYALRVFADINRRDAKPKEVESLKQGIEIVHADLEGTGSLKKAAKKAA